MGENKQVRQTDVDRFMEDMDSKMGQVFFILKEFPEARDKDGILLTHWLQLFKGVSSFDSLIALADANELSFESIRRARQKIQAAGHFLPDDENVIRRRRLQEVWRTSMAAT